MSDIVERLLEGIGSYSNLGRVSTSAGLIREAAARIEELEAANDYAFKSEVAGVEHCKMKVAEAWAHALEEAAQIAESLGRHLVRGESGPEYVGGNLDVAAAIRSLAKAKEADNG